MNEPLFLFYGGNYKRNIDDHRIRVPLTPVEIDSLVYDPHVPLDTDNSISTELDMGEFADLFCDLKKDDEIYIGVLPDACVYRGVWAMSFNAVKDFQVKFDLVRMRDVHNALVQGNPLKALPAVPNTAALNYDFSDGLGDAPEDALTKSKLPYGGKYDTYRNNAALKFAAITPGFFTALGEAMYIRMTIVKVGDAGKTDEGNCCSCGKPKFPVFQVGCLYDRLCAEKTRHQRYCDCDRGPCAGGCDDTTPIEGVTYKALHVSYVDNNGKSVYASTVIRIKDGEMVTVTPPKLANLEEPPAVKVKFANGKLTDDEDEAVSQIVFTYQIPKPTSSGPW